MEEELELEPLLRLLLEREDLDLDLLESELVDESDLLGSALLELDPLLEPVLELLEPLVERVYGEREEDDEDEPDRLVDPDAPPLERVLVEDGDRVDVLPEVDDRVLVEYGERVELVEVEYGERVELVEVEPCPLVVVDRVVYGVRVVDVEVVDRAPPLS